MVGCCYFVGGDDFLFCMRSPPLNCVQMFTVHSKTGSRFKNLINGLTHLICICKSENVRSMNMLTVDTSIEMVSHKINDFNDIMNILDNNNVFYLKIGDSIVGSHRFFL